MYVSMVHGREETCSSSCHMEDHCEEEQMDPKAGDKQSEESTTNADHDDDDG